MIEHFCETNGLRFCRLNSLEPHLKSESLRRVEIEQKDALRIARRLLYFNVGNMIRQQRINPNHIIEYYYRLKEKRPHPKLNKVAMIACMNKTLKCLLSMIKYHEKYTDSMVPVKV